MLSGQCDVAVRVASKEVHSATKVEEWHGRCQLASCQCECHRTPTEAGTKKRVWRLLPALGAVMLLAACDTTKATPSYGNGVNDDFKSAETDTSRRYTYGHALRVAYGRDYTMHPNSTGRHGHRRGAKSLMEFFRLNAAAIDQWPKVLRKGALAVVNTKDTVNTKGETVVPLTEWWEGAMRRRGFVKLEHRKVPAAGLRHGANSTVRNPWENVVTYKLLKEVPQ